MQIEIWSDVVCPWCYIGKRRLERALADVEHADEVEVRYRSFLLDPSAPAVATQTVAEHLGSTYGGGLAAGLQMIERTEAVAAEEGLRFRLREARRVGTLDAHRLLHLAHDEGGVLLQGELKEALLAAYFLRAENLADHDLLRRTALAAGLSAARVDEVLAGDEYADAVEADVREASSLGATGVPFFVVDRRYGVSGAQPSGVLAEVLRRAWSDTRAPLHMTGSEAGGTDEACGPDGCAV